MRKTSNKGPWRKSFKNNDIRICIFDRNLASATPRKVRFNGHQWEAYRFIHCVLNQEIASRDHVIRHRCHNRLCVNPDHLEIGSQADNKRDDWAHWAYGTDPDYL
jgi:hypothetical protein